MGIPGTAGLGEDEGDGGWIIQGGFRVGHASERGHTAGQGCGRARSDGFVLFSAGFAQVNVHVDPTGTDDQPGSVQGVVRFGSMLGTDSKDAIVAEPKVRNLVQVLRRVDNAAIPDTKKSHVRNVKRGRG
jgi:hypothetical protein